MYTIKTVLVPAEPAGATDDELTNFPQEMCDLARDSEAICPAIPANPTSTDCATRRPGA